MFRGLLLQAQRSKRGCLSQSSSSSSSSLRRPPFDTVVGSPSFSLSLSLSLSCSALSPLDSRTPLSTPRVPLACPHSRDPYHYPCRWALGVWCHLGAIMPNQHAGGVGCSLTVVHDRLLVTGGCREGRSLGPRFSGSSLVWLGTFDGVARQMSASLSGDSSACTYLHYFEALPDLNMVTPMHAHTVFTMPLLSPGSAASEEGTLLTDQS